MNKLQTAIEIARESHRGQFCGGKPYQAHLIMAWRVAKRFGVYDEDIEAAIFLHDVLEDTKTPYSKIRRIIGARTANLVYLVTDELGRNRKERMMKTLPKISTDEDAIFIKLCDRIANVCFSIMRMNRSKFDMYKNEYDFFKQSLFRGKNKYWDMLDILMQAKFNGGFALSADGLEFAEYVTSGFTNEAV